MMDKITKLAVKDLSEKYQPHTIIVYGSRARGDVSPDSDIDIACFLDQPSVTTDARKFNGCYLDVWIYSTESMNQWSDEFLKFESAYCVVDQLGLGQQLLEKVKTIIAKGPESLSPEEKRHIKKWVYKMLERAAKNDVEGYYRRTWLQFELLQYYFSLRDKWFLGAKQSLSWLEKNDQTAFRLFSDTYKYPQNLQIVKELADYTTAD